MNKDEIGVIKTHVPDKGISEITLRNLDRYDEADLLSRTGIPKDPNYMPRNNDEKVMNRFEGLKLMISLQQHIISGSNMATIEANCNKAWLRKYKKEEDQKEHPFDEEDNDINEFKAILFFLDECEQAIEIARKTKKLDDDFMWEKQNHNGKTTFELSPNFFDMQKELVDSYRSIYTILLNNKIVTLGQSDDADKTEKEKEEELITRILNA